MKKLIIITDLSVSHLFATVNKGNTISVSPSFAPKVELSVDCIDRCNELPTQNNKSLPEILEMDKITVYKPIW